MVRSLVALVLRRVLAWLVGSNEHAKDLEIVVFATNFRCSVGASAGLGFGGATGSSSPQRAATWHGRPGAASSCEPRFVRPSGRSVGRTQSRSVILHRKDPRVWRGDRHMPVLLRV